MCSRTAGGTKSSVPQTMSTTRLHRFLMAWMPRNAATPMLTTGASTKRYSVPRRLNGPQYTSQLSLWSGAAHIMAPKTTRAAPVATATAISRLPRLVRPAPRVKAHDCERWCGC